MLLGAALLTAIGGLLLIGSRRRRHAPVCPPPAAQRRDVPPAPCRPGRPLVRRRRGVWATAPARRRRSGRSRRTTRPARRRSLVTCGWGTPSKIVATERVVGREVQQRGGLGLGARQERGQHAAEPAAVGGEQDAPAERVDRRPAGHRARPTSLSISAMPRRSAATASTTGTVSSSSSSGLAACGDAPRLDVVDDVERRDAERRAGDVVVPHRLHQRGHLAPHDVVLDDAPPATAGGCRRSGRSGRRRGWRGRWRRARARR